VLELRAGVEVKGRYLVLDEIGTGGNATVWRAYDKQLNRTVALKRLLKRSWGQDTSHLAAFQEAEKNAQMSHTNIVDVHDVFEVDGEALIVMEYVDGASLERLLRDHALRAEVLPLDTAVAILRDILEGVDFAHTNNICHRDLSPANILLTSGGTAKVSDFGIAKVVNPKADLHPGSAVQSQAGTGTANYMSPEQARGEPADFASDLFMTGILGYLLLTGRHPFSHPSGLFTVPEILRKDDYNPETPKAPASLSTAQQRLFREYSAIIMRLLQRERAGRFASAREAIDAIESVTPTLECPECGERVPDHHLFCGFCRANLAVAESRDEQKQVGGLETPDALVESGYQLSLLKKWDAAIQRYKRAIELDPRHKKALRNLAFALNSVGRYEDALSVLDTGLAMSALLSEHRATMLYVRSQANQNLRRYEAAYSDIQKALELKPRSPKLLYARAKLQEFRGNFEEAKSDARDVVKRIPDHTGALRLLDQYES